MRIFWSIFYNCMPLLTSITAISGGPSFCFKRHNLQGCRWFEIKSYSSTSYADEAKGHEKTLYFIGGLFLPVGASLYPLGPC